MAYNELTDSIDIGVVETYRDILTPIIEQSNSEGSSSSTTSSGFGLLLCLVISIGIVPIGTIYLATPMIPTIIVAIITFIVMFELIPFRLLKRLKDYRRKAKNIQNTFKQLNKIRSINEDGTISVNNVTGILLECTTNFYLNLNNYTTDFDRYISMFHRFNISITSMANIGKVNYVDLDKLGVYNDKVIKYERIRLAKQVKKELNNKSKIYMVYLFISAPDHAVEELLRAYRESLTSTYRRVFSKIELVTGDKLYQVLSRELLIPINKQNLFSTRGNTEKKEKKDEIINVKEI